MKFFEFIKSLRKKTFGGLSLVLSGGGARGAIHLGVLQALDEHDIKIEAVSGTSIGAIVGALYCAGMSPLDIKKLMETKKFASVFQLSWNRKGLLTMTKLKKTLTEFIPVNDFQSLKIPFYCCVSNLESGKFEIIDSGDLSKAVLASASIPILFAPIEINGQHYVDGGLLNNLPVEPFESKKNVLGVHVNNYKYLGSENIRSIAERVFTLVSRQTAKSKLAKCNYVIEPLLEKPYRVLDFRNTAELFEIGYEEGKKFVAQSMNTF
jgi:NTE family protein